MANRLLMAIGFGEVGWFGVAKWVGVAMWFRVTWWFVMAGHFGVLGSLFGYGFWMTNGFRWLGSLGCQWILYG